jgi:hypothetical protein
VYEELELARRLERELRAELEDDDDEHPYEPNCFESVMQAAFDAALRLEANFESRLFADDAEPA